MVEDRMPDSDSGAPENTGGGMRLWLKILLGGLSLLVILLGAGAWYLSSPRFQTVADRKVVSVLEDSVGGRVEIRDLRWNIFHLTVYADDLTIHGLEAASDVPYFHADHVTIGIRILSIFSPKVSLSLLRVEHPVAHLIVYKDGTTNQPKPRKASTSGKSTINTVFDLQAQEVELVNGLALVNQRALPFNLNARDLNARVTYQPASTPKATDDRYNLALAVSDLASQMKAAPEVHSHLEMNLQLGRDEADLKQLTWATGIAGRPSGRSTSGSTLSTKGSKLSTKGSKLKMSGSLSHFDHPQWTVAAKGDLDLRQIGDLVDLQGISSGVASVDVKGHSCSAEEISLAQTTAKKPIGARQGGRPSVDEMCGEAYAVDGHASLHGVAYRNPYVDLTGVELETRAHITPTFLILTEATGSVAGGGSVKGQLHIVNWANSSPPQVPPLTASAGRAAVVKAAAATPSPHAVLEAEVSGMPLRTIMQIVSPKEYQELGFDTAGTGKMHVEWGSTPASVNAQAQLTVAPTGVIPAGAHSAGVPVTGAVEASYEGRGETVLLNALRLKTMASSIDASGVIGVAEGDGKTNLRVDLLTSDLGEFNQLLLVMGWETNGHKGASSIPVELHGTAQFHGTAVGGLHTLDVKGHLEAQQFDAVLDTIFPVAPAPAPATVSVAGNSAGTAQTAKSKIVSIMEKIAGPAAGPAPVPVAVPAPASQAAAHSGGETSTSPVLPALSPKVLAALPSSPESAKAAAEWAGTRSPMASTSASAPPTPVTSPTPTASPTPAVAPAAAAGGEAQSGAATGTTASDLAGTPRRLRLDSIVADAEYTPGRVTVRTAVIQRAGATLNISGSMTPHRIPSETPYPDYLWDKETSINGTFQLSHAVVGDALHLAGLDLPVSGLADAKAHVDGTMADLFANGELTLHGGELYGEPYQTLAATLNLKNNELEANPFVLTLPAGVVSGNGAYNLTSKHLRGHVTGKIEIAKLQAVKSGQTKVAGQVTLTADANGTMEVPNLKAQMQLGGLTLDGQAMGTLSADVHSVDSTLLFSSSSNLAGANIQASGQMRLTGNYDTQAKLTFSGMNIETLMRLYAPKSITGDSAIGGTLTLNGPLRQPKLMSATADLSQFKMNIVGIDLTAAEPLKLSMANGVLRIDQFHVVGPDTDVRASGTADLLNTAGGGGLRIHTEGAVNMKLAQTLDTDITSSGRVKLTVDARGTLQKPDLRGRVQLVDVNIGLQDLANGLSQVNGTLTFDRGRLQVESLTGMTGGGQLQLGGFIGFHNGLYADLTAKGNNVRIRYPPGVSSTANADLRLQGTQESSVLSGSILLTKFELGPSFDAASLASSSGGLTAPPDPNAPTSHIVLDVHITSAPQLDFQNSYAKLAGDVDLRIRGTVSSPSVLGKITITEGSATFAGTKYQLQRGDIYFTNPVRLEPIVDLDATARVRDYDLTIGLHGPANNLQPTYRSEPPLSEADIFALLALGRTQEQAQIYQQQEAQAGQNSTTNSLLYGALNATVSNRVSKLFGGGSVRVDPSFVGTMGNAAARITVEQSVAKNVTLTYATNVNATAEQLIQVQWDLTRNVSLVAVRDETGVFSLVFKIRRLYH